MSRLRAGSRGYTLIELMIVVVLIGISVSIAVPTISSAMAEQKQSSASLEVIDVYRSARSIAIRSGGPTLVLASAANNGSFWILQAPQAPGVAVGCGSVNWVALAALEQIPTRATLIFDDVLTTSDTTVAKEGWVNAGINATFPGVVAPATCYTPLGRVFQSVNGAAGPFSDAQASVPDGALLIEIRRANNGIVRNVVVPMGSGMPRLGN